MRARLIRTNSIYAVNSHGGMAGDGTASVYAKGVASKPKALCFARFCQPSDKFCVDTTAI